MSVCTSILIDISKSDFDMTEIGGYVHEVLQQIHRDHGGRGWAKIVSYDFQSFHINFEAESGERSIFLCKTAQDTEVMDGTIYTGQKIYLSLGYNSEGIEIMKNLSDKLSMEFNGLNVFFRESDSGFHENNEWEKVQ